VSLEKQRIVGCSCMAMSASRRTAVAITEGLSAARLSAGKPCLQPPARAGNGPFFSRSHRPNPLTVEDAACSSQAVFSQLPCVDLEGVIFDSQIGHALLAAPEPWRTATQSTWGSVRKRALRHAFAACSEAPVAPSSQLQASEVLEVGESTQTNFVIFL
jgi:hypothetical protein